MSMMPTSPEKFTPILKCLRQVHDMDHRLAFVDETGKEVVKRSLGYIDRGLTLNFVGGAVAVRRARVSGDINRPDYLWGIIDKNGNELVPCDHDLDEKIMFSSAGRQNIKIDGIIYIEGKHCSIITGK